MTDKPQRDDGHRTCPRVILSGLRGGSGKTVLTLGLIGALRKRGLTVAPFKKGPDYIDPQWMSLAAGSPCRNLDAFLMKPEQVISSIALHGPKAKIAVVEGNRGLHDGMDASGTYSTAELATLLRMPVILVVDCTKATRTVAAMVLGCKQLDPPMWLGGVILNRVARNRQAAVIRSAVESETGVPVLGVLPRLDDLSLFERHLGLHPPAEHSAPREGVDYLAERIEDAVDVESVCKLASSAPPIPGLSGPVGEDSLTTGETLQIGVVRDDAFHFYYPENIEALERCGARIVQIDALHDQSLPPLDGLYIGGGFPETHAQRLAANSALRAEIRNEIERGLPVLAECGGLIYLSEALLVDGQAFPMVDVFPIRYSVQRRPQGHGYTICRVDRENPFFPVGMELRGHEFRYAAVEDCRHNMQRTAFQMERGTGFDGSRDGLFYKNAFASFCHHHALGTSSWADGFIRLAQVHKQGKESSAPTSNGTYG